MADHTRRGLGGLILLVPAATLVGLGVQGLDPPAALVHPVVVMLGLVAAFLLNLPPAVSATAKYNHGALLGGVSIQVEGRVLNLAVIAADLLLLGAIALYLFLENFAVR